jgi:acyl-[acyl-carrier-protein]-phospholipid O-acyltransferase / long-chain-fatty-acid--[acyl-carrier-protein] ligase
VSLASVEDLLADLWPEHVVAAIAAPDPKRGERVILATTKPGATRAEVQTWMKIRGASEIMHPSSIVVLEAIPQLGSGKTNYVALAKSLHERGA